MASPDGLRNIAELHHETVNGSGHPRGLKGAQIPIEVHIVAVAGVFDALTSCRPYKRAWSNAEALRMLKKPAGIELDAECVAAPVDHPGEIELIQQRFREDSYG
jgi:HD-GYP domain-containing protein (c-di-GMP phosphodiesterase class II)